MNKTVKTNIKKVVKRKRMKKPVNIDNTRILKNFRMLQSDIKKLQRIAHLKKATQTRVISELIRIAYAGLFMPELKALDKFYKLILDNRIMIDKKEAIKKRKIPDK